MLIALVTIPVSLVAAALVLDLLGETFNAISFAGLAVALAIVIDDAVVGAENIARRLRQHREAGSDKSIAQIVVEASHEMRSPLAYATLIALLAIVPVAVMEGRPGRVLRAAGARVRAGGRRPRWSWRSPLTPALSLLLFSRGTPGRAESPLVRRLGPRYDGALSRFVAQSAHGADRRGRVRGRRHSPCCRCSGTSLIPSFKDRDVLVRLDGEPGHVQPAHDADRHAGQPRAAAHPGRRERRRARRARRSAGDQIVDVNSSEVWVSIDSRRRLRRDGRLDRGRRRPACAASRHDVVTYSTQKIRDVGALNEGENPVTGDGLDVLTGSDKPLAVRVFGQDQDVLRREASKVRQLVAGVDGVVEPADRAAGRRSRTSRSRSTSQKARREGIKPGDVRRAEATLLQGIEVGSVFEDQKVFEVIVQGRARDAPQRGERPQPADRQARRRSRPPRARSPTCGSRRRRP